MPGRELSVERTRVRQQDAQRELQRKAEGSWASTTLSPSSAVKHPEQPSIVQDVELADHRAHRAAHDRQRRAWGVGVARTFDL